MQNLCDVIYVRPLKRKECSRKRIKIPFTVLFWGQCRRTFFLLLLLFATFSLKLVFSEDTASVCGWVTKPFVILPPPFPPQAGSVPWLNSSTVEVRVRTILNKNHSHNFCSDKFTSSVPNLNFFQASGL